MSNTHQTHVNTTVGINSKQSQSHSDMHAICWVTRKVSMQGTAPTLTLVN